MIRDFEKTFVSLSSGRVDKIAAAEAEVPRTVFSTDSYEITVNGKKCKKAQKIKEGDSVTVKWSQDVFEGVVAEDIPLTVLYEDDDILVINKEQGMVVHPGAGNHEGTLVNALVGRYGEDFQAGEDDLRPGIVHRLDKDTSGVMVVAKNDEALGKLAEEFKEHTNEKYYYAIAEGFFTKRKGSVRTNISRSEYNRKLFTTTESAVKGKTARTDWTLVRQYDGFALIRVRLFTGRTHQIRVHMKSINHPLVGDVLYNPKKEMTEKLMLHAAVLKLHHPRTGEWMTFKAELPERFERMTGEHVALPVMESAEKREE